MKTTVIGAYPKISDEHQDLRRALHRHDRGELDADGLAGVLNESTRWAIGELDWIFARAQAGTMVLLPSP